MQQKVKTLQSVTELSKILKQGDPVVCAGSRTSTVIPFECLETWRECQFTLLDLSQIPPEINWLEDGMVEIKGAATWRDLRGEALKRGRELKTTPTEELALVLAGAATSCSGDRSFAYGPMREHILELEYVSAQGEIKKLRATDKLSLGSEHDELLQKYQHEYRKFMNFKNAPFPRLEKETDIMVGTEGQLGIISSAILSTDVQMETQFVLVKMDHWYDNADQHLEFLNKCLPFRGQILSIEMLDKKSLEFLQAPPVENCDIILLEINKKFFDQFFDEIVLKLHSLAEQDFFELSKAQYRTLRSDVPRRVQESNVRNNRWKQGTDIQVKFEDLPKLLQEYRQAVDLGVPCLLFGHIGDCHLHFNFLADEKNLAKVNQYLKALYQKVQSWGGSPFAEHGIGLLKQSYIKDFWGPSQTKVFEILKATHDPQNILFPMGYMNIKI